MLSELQSSGSKLFTYCLTLSHLDPSHLSASSLPNCLLALMCGNAICCTTLCVCYYLRLHERLYWGTKQRYVPINALLQREDTDSPSLPPTLPCSLSSSLSPSASRALSPLLSLSLSLTRCRCQGVCYRQELGRPD